MVINLRLEVSCEILPRLAAAGLRDALDVHFGSRLEEHLADVLLDLVNSVQPGAVEREDFIAVEGWGVSGPNYPGHLLVVEVRGGEALEEEAGLVADLPLELGGRTVL